MTDPETSVPEATGPPARSSAASPASGRASFYGIGSVLVAVAVVWCGLYLQRRSAHQPNVDDYLYASAARKLYSAFASSPASGVRAVLNTGHTAPLVPLLAAPLTRAQGIEGAVAVNLPFLLALTGGAYLLARRWVGPRGAAAIAMVTALNPAVLGWSQMLNFSIAATALLLWALAAYLHSDGFRRWRWSLTTGVAVGLLLLSRSIAPVYVAPLAAVMALQSFTGVRRNHLRASLPQIGASAALVLLIAAPWWTQSGATAIDWLLQGYDSSTGVGSGSHGVIGNITYRADVTLTDLGTIARAAFLAFAGVAVVVAAVRRRFGADEVAVVGWAIGCFAILVTASNAGTGFGLPLLAVVTVAAGAALTRLPARALLGTTTVAAVLLVAGIAGELSHSDIPGLSGPVYRFHVVQSGAPATTDVEGLHDVIADTVKGGTVLIARDDGVLNANGLAWATKEKGGIHLVPVPGGREGTRTAISGLAGASFLITGDSEGLFNPNIDQGALEGAAREQGFVLVFAKQIGLHNSVRVWQREPQTSR